MEQTSLKSVVLTREDERIEGRADKAVVQNYKQGEMKHTFILSTKSYTLFSVT